MMPTKNTQISYAISIRLKELWKGYTNTKGENDIWLKNPLKIVKGGIEDDGNTVVKDFCSIVAPMQL